MMIIDERKKANNCFSSYNVEKGYLKLLLDSTDADDNVALYLIIEDLIKQPRCCILKFLFFEELKANILNSRKQKLKPKVIKSMLEAVCKFNSVDYVDSNGLSFLHIGCFYGHTDTVNKYLSKGSTNAQCFFGNEGDQNGLTPLHLAVMNSEHETLPVKILLYSGAHVNAKDFQDQTPLHIASRMKLDIEAHLTYFEVEIIDDLLRYNGDVNAQDKLGNTPLLNVLPHHLKDPESSFKVCFSHNLHLSKADRKFELLMFYSPNLAITNNEGENLLHYIVGNLCYSSYSALNSVTKYDVNSASSQHFTLVQLLEEILRSDLKFNINQRNNAGYTPLQIALLSMNADVFEILLKNGADLKHIKFDVDDKNYRSFHWKFLPNLKTITSLLKIIELILQKDFKLTEKDNLAIVKFLTHGGNDCMCGYPLLGHKHYSDTALISNLINYGTPLHINHILNGRSYMCNNSHFRFIVYNELKQYLECVRQIEAYRSKETEIIIDKYIETWDDPQYRSRYKSPDIASDLAILKSTVLTKNMNMLDIIMKNPRSISYHILESNFNHKLTKDLESFKNIVEGHIAKCFTRYHIDRLATCFVEKLFNYSLVDLCYRKMLSYLGNEDIFNICQAALLRNTSVNGIKP